MPKAVKPLSTTGKKGEWWVKDPNNPDVGEYGPYDTKAEADDIRVGMARTWRKNKWLLEDE